MNLISCGYEGRYFGISLSAAGTGVILGLDEGKFRLKVDPPAFFGFDISINFGQIY